MTDLILNKITSGDFTFVINQYPAQAGVNLCVSFEYQLYDYILWFELGRNFHFRRALFNSPYIVNNENYAFLEKDEYFNLSTENEIPDCVLEDNYYKIESTIYNRIKNIYNSNFRYDISIRLMYKV